MIIHSCRSRRMIVRNPSSLRCSDAKGLDIPQRICILDVIWEVRNALLFRWGEGDVRGGEVYGRGML